MVRASSILLVDDDAGSIKLLRRALAELGQLRFATSGPDARRLAHAAAPDLVNEAIDRLEFARDAELINRPRARPSETPAAPYRAG